MEHVEQLEAEFQTERALRQKGIAGILEEDQRVESEARACQDAFMRKEEAYDAEQRKLKNQLRYWCLDLPCACAKATVFLGMMLVFGLK